MRIVLILLAIILIGFPFTTDFNSSSDPIGGNNDSLSSPDSQANMTWLNPQPTGNSLSSIQWNPAGTEAVITGAGSTVLSYDGNSFKKIPVEPLPGLGLYETVWKPDGSYALISGRYGIGNESTAILYKYNGVLYDKIENTSNFAFFGMSWKPDGTYALVTGDFSFYKYDGVKLTEIPLPTIPPDNLTLIDPYDVAWHPDGSYALIIGGGGGVYKYDEVNITPVGGAPTIPLYDLAWKPQGDYALIVGWGAVLKFNGISIVPVPVSSNNAYISVGWGSNGDFAVITGMRLNGGEGLILKYNGITHLTYIYEYVMGGVSGKSGADSIHIVGEAGMVCEFDGTTITPISSGFRDYINAVEWKPDGSYALIATNTGLICGYDGSSFNLLHSDENRWFTSISWNSDGSKALIAGTDIVLYYDGFSFKEIDAGDRRYVGVEWKPGEDVALLMGGPDVSIFYDSAIQRTYSVDPDSQFDFIDAAWSPDGNSAIIISFWDEGVVIYDHAKGKLDIVNSGTDTLLKAVDWNPVNSKAIAIGYENGNNNDNIILIYDGNDLEKQTYPSTNAYFSSVHWIPGTESALVGSDYGRLFLYSNEDLTEINSDCMNTIEDISWNKKTGKALLVGDYGTVISYERGDVVKNDPPTITIEKPLDQAAVSGVLAVSGTALDPDPSDSIVSVELRYRNESWNSDWIKATGTTSWSSSWDTETVANGWYTIQVRAFDSMLYSKFSSVTVNVQNNININPTCMITGPANGATVEGVVVISGTAADLDSGDLIDSVEILITSGSWESGWMDAAGTTSWSFSWNTKEVVNGDYTIRAKSCDGELYSDNTTITVKVQNIAENHKPVCTIVSPGQNDVIEGVYVISGTSSEPDEGDEVTEVTLWINGELRNVEGIDSWHYNWDTTSVANGDYSISARAFDGELYSDIHAVDVTVNNPTSSNRRPTCYINDPEDAERISGTYEISGISADPDGDESIALIEVKISNGEGSSIWVTAENTVSWSHKWDSTGVDDGPYTIYARAFDGELFSLVAKVDVEVDNVFENIPPTCEIIYPGQDFTISGTIVIEVTADDRNGEVDIVQVKVDNEKWRTMVLKDNYQYELDTTRLEDGYHTISARAFDGTDHSIEAQIGVYVDNSDQPVEDTTEFDSNLIILGLLALVIVAIIIFLYISKGESKPTGTYDGVFDEPIEVESFDD